MTLRNLNESSSTQGWDEKWAEIFDKYQNDLRHAYYVHAMLGHGEHHVLELAAGSFRDMAELRRRGIDCEGMDFSPESVNLAKRKFPEFSSKMHCMSAFEMPFRDKHFDTTYHNGFWVLFSDGQVRSLAKEQARITRSRMIATVHNAHNKPFAEYFDKMKQNDPLYDIRFYAVDEISALMNEVCDNVVVVPVGKGKRRHEDFLIKLGVTSPALLRAYFKLSGHRLLNCSERLLCMGTPKS